MELHVDLEQIKNRLRARDNHSSETSDARLEDLEKLSAAYEPPSELVADLIKVSASGSASDTVKAVLFQLAEKSVSRTDSFCGEQ